MDTNMSSPNPDVALADLSFSLLHGRRENFAPVTQEWDAPNLEVEGRIPEALDGAYLRNGPNPAFEPQSYLYPLDGDGMIHGVFLADGRAHYRNRWVVTRGLRADRRAGRALYGGVMTAKKMDPALVAPDGDLGPYKNVSSTSIVRCGGRILSLYELGLPYELSPGLETIGEWCFEGRLAKAMTAHPKLDPQTGETHFIRYDAAPPYLTYYVADRDGRIVHTLEIDLPEPVMVHDFLVTDRHVVIFDCPALLSDGRLSWQPSRGTRIGVLPRGATSSVEMRWLTTHAFFLFHIANGFSDASSLTVDYVRRFSILPGRLGDDGSGRWHVPSLHRLRVDLAGGLVTEERLDDHMTEFPRCDERRAGLRYRYAYLPAITEYRDQFRGYDALIRYDLERGTQRVRPMGGRKTGEAIFVPNPSGADELDGWVMSFVYDPQTGRSALVILNAGDFTGEPAAVVHLPGRVPDGNHGSWFPGLRLI
jgi:carotenoid cleavage dioxygenase